MFFLRKITINKSITLILATLLLLLLLSTSNIVKYETPFVSILVMVLMIFLFYSIIKRKGILISQFKVYSPYLLFLLVYAANILYKFDTSAFNNLVFYITYGMFLFVILNINWDKFHMRLFSFVAYTGLFIMFYFIFFQVDNTINTNVIGIISFVLLFFPLVYILENKKRFKKLNLLFLFLFCGYIIYNSGSRSVFLGISFMLITYIIWNFIAANKILFKLYFGAIISFIISYTLVYPNLHRLITDFYKLQSFVIKHTGKAIYSGRNRIWEILLDKIYEKPFLGHGAGTLASEFIGTDQSSHNLYLEITLQVGVIGLILFFLFLYNLWKVFWDNRYNKTVKLSASFFIAVLVHQINEVLLIKSSVSINFMLWMAFGIGLSKCFNQLPKEHKDKNLQSASKELGSCQSDRARS